jgi:hypothetical protein
MTTSTLRALTHIGPGGSHWVALRASICVLFPMLVLTATGHTSWCVYAAFGAFAGLYGRYRDYGDRVRMQATAAVLLVAAVVTGTLTALGPDPRWMAVAGAAVWAGIGGVATDAFDWHPPGSLFLVFAYAVCAAVPATPSSLLVALVVTSGAALLALLLGASGALLPRSAPRSGAGPGPGLRYAVRRPGAGAHLLRLAGGAGAAGGAATAIGLGHPYWATVAAVVPMAAPDTSGRLLRGVQRLAGTAAGLLLAAGLLAPHLPVLGVVLVVAVLQLLAELLIGRNYALALVFVTPLALLLGQLGRPLPAAGLLRDRAVETLLGVIAAVALTLLTHDREH